MLQYIFQSSFYLMFRYVDAVIRIKLYLKRVEIHNCRMMMLMGGMHKNFHPQKMINGSRKRCNQIISHKYQQAIYREILNFSSEQNVRYTLSLIYNLGIINVIIMYTKYYKTKYKNIKTLLFILKF